MMRILGRILLALVVISMLAFAYWRYDFRDRENRVAPEALPALASDDLVTVEDNSWIVFRPTGSDPSKGMIFYPGGEVDERGYAETLRAVAAAGYLVVLTPMPLQLAVFAPNEQLVSTYSASQASSPSQICTPPPRAVATLCMNVQLISEPVLSPETPPPVDAEFPLNAQFISVGPIS